MGVGLGLGPEQVARWRPPLQLADQLALGRAAHALGRPLFGRWWRPLYLGAGALGALAFCYYAGRALLALGSGLDLLIGIPLQKLMQWTVELAQEFRQRPHPRQDFRRWQWGPGRDREGANETFASLRSRDDEGRAKQCVLGLNSHYARLARGGRAPSAPTMSGMSWTYIEVVGDSGRRIREQLEGEGNKVVHLCRRTP